MPDPEIAAIRAQIAARTRATEIPQMRRDYDARGLAFGLPSDVAVEPVSANGVKAEWASPPVPTRRGQSCSCMAAAT